MFLFVTEIKCIEKTLIREIWTTGSIMQYKLKLITDSCKIEQRKFIYKWPEGQKLAMRSELSNVIEK